MTKTKWQALAEMGELKVKELTSLRSKVKNDAKKLSMRRKAKDAILKVLDRKLSRADQKLMQGRVDA